MCSRGVPPVWERGLCSQVEANSRKDGAWETLSVCADSPRGALLPWGRTDGRGGARGGAGVPVNILVSLGEDAGALLSCPWAGQRLRRSRAAQSRPLCSAGRLRAGPP